MTEPPTAEKSAEAYRTIGEVAEELKLPQHVLRFWETRFPQIKPLKRAGGRRFYRPEDLALLRAVKLLLYGEGYTIKGVQRLLQEQGPKAVAAVLARPGSPVQAKRSADDRPATKPGADAGTIGPADVLPFPDGPPAPRELKPALAPAPSRPGTIARLEALAIDLEDCARLLVAGRATER